MDNIIIIAVIAVIVFAAGLYIYKVKKSGKKCIGCPYSGSCSDNKHTCDCSGKMEEK